MLLYRLFLIIWFLCWVVGKSALAQVVDGASYPPDLKVGQKWGYQVINLWKGDVIYSYEESLAKIDGEMYDFVYKSSRGGERERKYLNGLNRCAQPKGSERWVCPKVFSFPMRPGSVVEFEDWPGSSGGALWSENCKRREVERIKVPAGTFDAVRVECDGFWDRGFGIGGVTRNRGWLSERFWYSSEVGRWVAYEYKDFTTAVGHDGGALHNQYRHELVNYQPRANE